MTFRTYKAKRNHESNKNQYSHHSPGAQPPKYSMFQHQSSNINVPTSFPPLKPLFAKNPKNPQPPKTPDTEWNGTEPPIIPKNSRPPKISCERSEHDNQLHPLNIPTHFFYHINNCIRINIIWYGDKNLCWYKVFFFDAHIDLVNELASDDVIN